MRKIDIILPEKIGAIAPEIYGHFSEHIGGVFYDGLWVGKNSTVPNINGWRTEAVEALRKINPPVLRWPGGCFAEAYNWRDGIGENRPVRPNWWTPWDKRYESNEVGTHEFMELCELIGAKAYFAINVTSITPLEARDWMDYCLSPRGSTTLALEREKNGRPEPFDIPFLGIGNENWGDGGNMTPDYYALEYRRFATVLNNIGRTSGKPFELIAGGANGGDWAWTHGLASNLSQSRAPLHAMSFHYYCGNAGDPTNFTDEEWYRQLAQAEKMEELIIRHDAITRAYGMQGKMKQVIDEWGCWHRDGSGPSNGYNLFEQQSTVRDAMVTALTLNLFNNHCDKIRMANVAQVCNNLHCLMLAGGDKFTVTPTYHVFHMYKEHQGGNALRTLVSDNGDIHNRISVSASEKNGTLTVTLANLSHDTDETVDLSLLGLTETVKECSASLLTASDIHAHNTFESPEAVKPVTTIVDLNASFVLPHASVMAISIKFT